MKKILFTCIFLIIGNCLFAQATDEQIRQAANTLGVPYEALRQFVDSYRPQTIPSGTIVIESRRLSEEYYENTARADIQYKGKLLQISGPIDDVRSYSWGYEITFANGIPPWHWLMSVLEILK